MRAFSTLPCAQTSTAVRTHWARENKLHWSLEVTWSEEAHRLREAPAIENLALVRKMALNLLRPDPMRGSFKKKRKRLDGAIAI